MKPEKGKKKSLTTQQTFNLQHLPFNSKCKVEIPMVLLVCHGTESQNFCHLVYLMTPSQCHQLCSIKWEDYCE